MKAKDIPIGSWTRIKRGIHAWRAEPEDEDVPMDDSQN